ncbi:MAG: TlpA family protein disulfide reductase [Nitrospinae bacterium]|nr:TlpA family protein disulfide reductase [Nitrospinota bacterium]
MGKILIKASIIFLLLFISSPLWAAWINDKSPYFTLQDIKGSAVSLGVLKGKVVYINFWASWCPPCKEEFPELNKLAEKYNDSDFIILAVNVDKVKSNMDDFLSKMPLPSKNMIILVDPKAAVVSSYNARAMPTSFIVDKEGVIRYMHLGFNENDPEKWVKEVESLLK